MFAADILSVTDKFCKEPLALPLMLEPVMFAKCTLESVATA